MRRASGFTLLEVMVATALAAVGIVSVLELFAGSARLARASASQTEAIAVASAVMDRALWRAELPETELEGESGQYQWTLSIQRIDPQLSSEEEDPRENESDLYDLMEVIVSVRWGIPGAEKTVSLQSARVMEQF